ncbi:DNA cytosine methyltransferase [Streptomyces sp. NPDC002734]|uniref:DNA cytosine methyltransferase n=1 Tax=Streptomyces sp. NPDC002734 TaxID=3154426 RepID=UPI00331D51F9
MTSPEPHATTRTSNSEDEYDILDLFAGPGGLDVAAHFLGRKAIGIEWDANACETRYSAGLATIHADVCDMRRDPGQYRDLLKNIRVLAGGPPCQTFSVAGSGTGRQALDEVSSFIHRLVDDPDSSDVIDKELSSAKIDERTALVLEPLRWILGAILDEDRKPFETIILEQVPAVLPVWEVYERVLRHRLPNGVRYRTVSGVLRTEQYGVPQTRKRAVLIAQLGDGPEPLLPRSTHQPFTRLRGTEALAFEAGISEPQAMFDLEPAPQSGTREPNDPAPLPVTMAAALEAAREQVGPAADLPPRSSFVVRSNYGSGGDPKKRGERAHDEPAFTVTGKVSRNVVMSKEGADKFSIPEAGVLQTFPGNFPWGGKDRAQQVGNAVPPRFGVHLLAAALGVDEAARDRALAGMGIWPGVTPEQSNALRELGCGTHCPPTPPHPAREDLR